MKKVVNLTEMNAGEKGRVVNILGGCGLIRRLEIMGIRIGVEITKISEQFIVGPVTIKVGESDSQISIGYGMATKILVEVENLNKKQ